MAKTPTGAAEMRGRALKPLGRVFPYVLRYRWLAAGAIVALVAAAATTLTLPLAVRRMIDHGFTTSDTTFVANYFAMLLVIAAVLALASAGRYYFVVTLGERVVADLRKDVFDHVAGLSPAFFDRVQSGEILSRLAADTTQIKSAVGATTSLALRNAILGLGAVGMMVVTSPKLSGLMIAAIPLVVLPLVARFRDLEVALRIERRWPGLNDRLASAVQFLRLQREGREDDLNGSPELREATIAGAGSFAPKSWRPGHHFDG